ncbi:conserved hypothetical protein [Cenarchaeum symbiosum A]|uniref:Nucleotidyl transferase AbiEii/AbiGii toxin family protein n=1 Tax=Cenarchaeum symbiosum (strain A) TaxID=414004 RepID=A0RWG6_CENSY|nr:conserved hypothetical protein [Cenarchaeum symbiosum A]
MDALSIRRIALKKNLPRGVIERDYVLTNLLSVMVDFPKIDKMVFKGGTSLKKAYFEDFRYSEDLDFGCLEDVSEEFKDYLRHSIRKLDVDFAEIKPNKRKGKSSFKIMYNSIFRRAGADADTSAGGRLGVDIDMNLSGSVIIDPQNKQLLDHYPEFPGPYSMPTMSLEETMAEKVSALTHSRHARHLYDVVFLHSRGVPINMDMVNTKTKSEYEEDFDLDKLTTRIYEKKVGWAGGLKPFIPHSVPDFDDTVNYILKAVKEAMNEAPSGRPAAGPPSAPR